MGSEHPEKYNRKSQHNSNSGLCRSVFKTQTCELTAQELHSQCAVLPADLWVNADVLRFDWRTEGVGRGGIIISISSEYLQ